MKFFSYLCKWWRPWTSWIIEKINALSHFLPFSLCIHILMCVSFWKEILLIHFLKKISTKLLLQAVDPKKQTFAFSLTSFFTLTYITCDKNRISINLYGTANGMSEKKRAKKKFFLIHVKNEDLRELNSWFIDLCTQYAINNGVMVQWFN